MVTCLVLMIGASVDLSMGTIYSHSDSRSYGRCICSALAYAGATWATYAWAHLVIFQKSTEEQLSQPSPSALLTDRQTQEQYPELVRTTRLISGVLTFLIGLFEVCWRITLVRDYSIGWHLQQTSTMLQFIFLLLVGIPVARFCSYEWIECQQARDVFHWLATSCLFIGWAVGTGRLAAAFRILGFCESPLGRLLWLLQLVCFTITAISLHVMEQRHDAEQVGEFKGVVIEKPLPCIPGEVHNGRRLTNVAAALTHRGSNEAAQAMDVTPGLSDGQPQGLALMRTPRRKQPLVEGSSAFPVPPSTPAGVPSSVYLPAETPSMYLDSMRAEYLASGPRERAISLPLNRLPTTPSSHGGGPSLSDLVMGLPKPNTSNGKLSHRGRSSSLGDALTRRTSHDTFMAMKRRYEGRAQAEKHRRARSASSDMTHLTVTR
ncbi:hypothetical protein BCV69DRAFT_33300 [Microstroma glucosiphilum]|uniref:Transmembrane protein n=1 Tax=Pseudomicrostroma glucosiphilum TaxID=1684307 RepID=A0A316U4R0_9BASI|nr:hypothetical protein BCV69DRAFT_33300 [Pseudomicrostroma glucosiphilum]PWN19818.1 hypothetical protein BCV69DRAFT_33300 [Pseudomicrostroma glucosiphilum]